MGVYVHTKYMAMPSKCFCFDFWFGTACGTIILQCPLAQQFPAAWAGGTASVQYIFLRYLCIRQWLMSVALRLLDYYSLGLWHVETPLAASIQVAALIINFTYLSVLLSDDESQISWSQKSLKMFKTNKVVKLKQWNH
jgi:hypothetical protein